MLGVLEGIDEVLMCRFCLLNILSSILFYEGDIWEFFSLAPEFLSPSTSISKKFGCSILCTKTQQIGHSPVLACNLMGLENDVILAKP
jgi:hypothetical protein